jgi:hypothetical protein
MTSRARAKRAATLKAGLAKWASDIAPIRGRCLGGTKRKPCPSRWAVIRVSLDFRDPERVDRLAVLECAQCGRVWRRVKPVAIRSREGYQAVRINVILPAVANRWYSRGRWKVEGTDALVLVDADLGDVEEAAVAHDARSTARQATRARAKVRREESDRVAIAKGVAALAVADAHREAADEAERAAAERDRLAGD